MEKIIKDDPSINPILHLELMDRGITGAHYYHLRDTVTADNNNIKSAEDHEEVVEEEAKEVEDEVGAEEVTARGEQEDLLRDHFFTPPHRRAVKDYISGLAMPAPSLCFMNGWHTPTPASLTPVFMPFPAALSPIPRTPGPILTTPTPTTVTAMPAPSVRISTTSARNNSVHGRNENRVSTSR